jgi:protocatechuate 3,4-dioxygenase beta subunit
VRKKRSSDTRTSDKNGLSPDAVDARGSVREQNIERRTALKTLGAIALYGPVLASMGCDGDPETTDASSSPAASGSGSDSGSTGAATTGGSTPDAGGSSGSGSTTDVSSSGSSSGGATDSGSQTHTDAATSGASDAGADAAVSTPLGDAGAGTTGFFPPMFTDAPTCTLTGTDGAGEGPFFIHEDEVMGDPSLKRVDMREGHEGVELQLNYRLLDADGNCMKGIADVEVYTWHTDAVGMYSGFNNQNPDMTYSGGIERTVENMDRFCRGMQVTNADGVVSFRSIYPGWYYGRPIHIHFVALRKGSMAATSSYRSAQYHIFTTQLYFEEQFSRKIHENNSPYKTRTSGAGYAMYVKPNAQSMVRPAVRMEGNVVVASINMITKASGNRT